MPRKKTNGTGDFNRAALLSLLKKRKALGRVALEIPEWGQTLYILRITARKAQALAEEFNASEGQDAQTAVMLKACLVDGNGDPLIETEADVAQLMESESASVVNRIMSEVVKLNPLGPTEETAKN